MSTLINSARAGVRTRVPRFAEAAVERARLTVVPPRRQLGRTQASRTPFAVLVLAMLVAGVVGLLMFNTNMQQTSFTATALQEHVNVLTAKEQSLNMELDQLRDPQRLAVEAKKLGMVAPAEPAFVRLLDGKILGNPTPASPADSVRVTPLPAPKPGSLRQRTIIFKAKPSITENTAQSRASTSAGDTPGTSTTAQQESGRKKASTQADSGASH